MNSFIPGCTPATGCGGSAFRGVHPANSIEPNRTGPNRMGPNSIDPGQAAGKWMFRLLFRGLTCFISDIVYAMQRAFGTPAPALPCKGK